ncbi:MAG: ABC transporter, partial [Chloroflexota bacterium]
RNIRRDSLLLWIPLIPLVIALAIRIGVPPLTGWLTDELGFDLSPYYPLIMSFYLVMTAAIVGVIVGFLLLDERDDRTLTALLITPMPLSTYILYRIGLPMLLGMGLTLIGYPIAGLVGLPVPLLLLVALMGTLSSPLMALVLAVFADNKVAGFAVMKIMNGVMLLPTLAFFLPEPIQFLAGIVPPFWALKVFWAAAEGSPWLSTYVVIGFLLHIVTIMLLLRRFTTILHR